MSGEKGLTIVEVLVASAILIFAVLFAATMVLTSTAQLRRSGEETAATVLAQQRMEWLRNQNYTSTDLAAGTTSEWLAGTYAGYTRSTLIEDDTPRAGVKRVTITTTTDNGRTATVVSLIAE